MKTLNTIYLWLMLAACVLALAGCVEEKVSGTGEGGSISVKMNVNARGGSDIQADESGKRTYVSYKRYHQY